MGMIRREILSSSFIQADQMGMNGNAVCLLCLEVGAS